MRVENRSTHCVTDLGTIVLHSMGYPALRLVPPKEDVRRKSGCDLDDQVAIGEVIAPPTDELGAIGAVHREHTEAFVLELEDQSLRSNDPDARVSSTRSR